MMGLQITMTADWKDTGGQVCVDFPRSQYGQLGVITGMKPEKVAQEGWSQLVDRETARRIAEVVGVSQEWTNLVNLFTPCCMIRVTIA